MRWIKVEVWTNSAKKALPHPPPPPPPPLLRVLQNGSPKPTSASAAGSPPNEACSANGPAALAEMQSPVRWHHTEIAV